MFLLFIPFCFLFTDVWCWCECIHLFHSVEMIDCVNACLSVCVFWIQRTKSLKKPIVLALPQIPLTITEYRTLTNILILFFRCDFVAGVLCLYASLPCHSIWLVLNRSFFLHFTHKAHRPKQQFCLRVSSIFTFHWCGLHTSFGFMTSGVCVLNVLHWTWLNDRFGFLCALHIYALQTHCKRAIVFRTFAVSIYCWMAMHFSKRCDASNRSIVRPFSTYTLNSMHTYYVDASWVIGWMNFFQTWIPFS